MKLLVLSLHNDNESHRCKRLTDSLDKHGYDYQLKVIPFRFGQQYHQIVDFCRNYTGDATHILYTDAWDTIAMAGPDEVIRKFEAMECKMLISAEKACFPYQDKAVLYPEVNTPWKYINGGGSMFEIEYMRNLPELFGFKPDYIDPDYLLECYLRSEGQIKLDHNCQIFQTIAHSNQSEWEVKGERLMNIGTKTLPVFFHGNGRTDMTLVCQVSEMNQNV